MAMKEFCQISDPAKLPQPDHGKEVWEYCLSSKIAKLEA
jgi:hypothetical protein